jgi:hypothetical protein
MRLDIASADDATVCFSFVFLLRIVSLMSMKDDLEGKAIELMCQMGRRVIVRIDVITEKLQAYDCFLQRMCSVPR